MWIGGNGNILPVDILSDYQKAVQAIPHPKYDPNTFSNDVALVLLDTPSTKPIIKLVAATPASSKCITSIYAQAVSRDLM